MDSYLVAAAFDAGIKLAAGGMLLFFSHQRHRKAAYYWGLSWIIYAYAIIGDLGVHPEIAAVLLGVFSSLVLQGVLRVKEDVSISQDYIRALSWGPAAIGVYTAILFLSLEKTPETAVMGIVYGASGVFLGIGGLILYRMREFYEQDTAYLGLSLSIYGVYQMLYPIFWRGDLRFWGLFISLVLTVVTALFMVQLSLGEVFEIKEPETKVEVQPGVHIMDPAHFEDFKKQFREYPVLAFVRNIDIPDNWKAYRITNLGGHGNVSPTNLPRITETVVNYIRSLENSDLKPVVVLEGIEYLKIYNDFRALAKFLTSLRDYVAVSNGTLVLVLEKDAWEEREMKTLERLLT
ncbi:DUF835 domain-containing protein [Thermococcus peptonophilus]|uniref:DUF835 domain-containing protein n=1 Tax=Thermococcus peptonophilus TaxID=53952 RepID=A0A142CTV7_9EURY|nr:DUF835 domain-containing protein [Thermococcus peptonophilus]AMQ18209.1 hypothetical protein A0127_03020 [Thermococcus peptonophilus]